MTNLKKNRKPGARRNVVGESCGGRAMISRNSQDCRWSFVLKQLVR